MNDSEIYSYHSFAFPFTWTSKQKKLRSFKGFTELFSDNPNWSSSDPQTETDFGGEDGDALFYKTYQFFYPQVRKAVFGGSGVVRTFSFTPSGKLRDARYLISRGGRSYELRVNAIRLRIYNTKTALIILECENHGTGRDGRPQNTLADVKNINDYGRRITLPFLPANPDWSVCADALTLELPQLGQAPTTDFRRFLTDYYRPEGGAKLSLTHLSDVLKAILSCGSDIRFSSRPDPEEDTVSVRAILDDRMFVACCVTDNEGAQKAKEWYHSKAPDAASEQSLYELIFMDPDGQCTCQDHDMRQRLMRAHIYARWIDYETFYSFSTQGFIMLLNEGAPPHLIETFLSIYIQMAYLALVQKASAVLFQKEAADLSVEMSTDKRHIRPATVTKMMDLQARFSAFESQMWVQEVSSEEQGIELFRLFTESLGTERQLGNVKSQLASLESAVETYNGFSFSKIGHIFAWIGAVFGLAELVLPAVLEQMKPQPNDLMGLWLKAGLYAVSVAAIFAFFQIRYRARRK